MSFSSPLASLVKLIVPKSVFGVEGALARQASAWLKKSASYLHVKGPDRFSEKLSRAEIRAFFDPQQNLALTPAFRDMQKRVQATHGKDHWLVVGYRAALPETLEAPVLPSKIWEPFDNVRNPEWVQNDVYHTLNAPPTLHIGIAKLQTNLGGTWLQPMAMSRCVQVNGAPRFLKVNSYPENTIDVRGSERLIHELRLHYLSDNIPEASLLQTERGIVTNRLTAAGMNGEDFMRRLGSQPLTEVGTLLVHPDFRLKSLGYGRTMGLVSRLTVQKVLRSNLITFTMPGNWSNSAKVSHAVFGDGAVLPQVLHYNDPNKPLDYIIMTAGDRRFAETVQAQGTDWVPLIRFANRAKDYRKAFEDGIHHQFSWL